MKRVLVPVAALVASAFLGGIAAVDFTREYALDGLDPFDRVVRLLAPAVQPILRFEQQTLGSCASWSSTTSPLFGTP